MALLDLLLQQLMVAKELVPTFVTLDPISCFCCKN